jgi:hypothetical protein
MTSPELQPDVRRYLLSSVPSVPYLEAVLLLRADPGVAWDAAGLARRLYVPERRGIELLGQLRESGMAVAAAEPGAVRYGPEPQVAVLMDRVAEAYASDPVGVSSLIHSRIDRRAQQFADAFRFRKD